MHEIDLGNGRDGQSRVASKPVKRLTVDLSRDVHTELKTRAAERETTMAEVLRGILAAWLLQENPPARTSVDDS